MNHSQVGRETSKGLWILSGTTSRKNQCPAARGKGFEPAERGGRDGGIWEE